MEVLLGTVVHHADGGSTQLFAPFDGELEQVRRAGRVFQMDDSTLIVRDIRQGERDLVEELVAQGWKVAVFFSPPGDE